MKIQATVIIAFYNRVNFLELVLAGLKRQSFKNCEVIISDDGSSLENVAKVNKLLGSYPFPISHLWHEDKGFRKNILLNKSICQAKSDIIIFMDGDCIPHCKFIEEHVNSTCKGKASTGRRVNLSEDYSDNLTPEKVEKGLLEKSNFRFFLDALSKKGNHSGQGVYIKSKTLRRILNKKERGVLGSNFSAHKKDLIEVNGFDERYEHPSVGEDTDIEFRLRLIGVQIKSLNNVANQYHLYHKVLPRVQRNLELFSRVKKSGVAITPFGINKKNHYEVASRQL